MRQSLVSQLVFITREEIDGSQPGIATCARSAELTIEPYVVSICLQRRDDPFDSRLDIPLIFEHSRAATCQPHTATHSHVDMCWACTPINIRTKATDSAHGNEKEEEEESGATLTAHHNVERVSIDRNDSLSLAVRQLL